MTMHRLSFDSIYRGLILLISLSFAPLSQAQDSPVYVLKNSEWNVPRTTQSVLAMPALRKTIQAYDKHPGLRIQIHYPGGDEGTLWVYELRSWLVTLGVASSHIVLLPGTRKPGQLELQVVSAGRFD